MRTLLVAFGALAIASTFAVPVAAATAGIAYDQISSFAIGASAVSTSPQPFASLRATALAATFTDLEYPTATGEVVPSVATIAHFLHGILVRKSFLGSNVRVDDPVTMRATISRPDKGVVIYLDLRAKTYHELGGADAHAVLFPPAYKLPDGLTASTPAPIAPSPSATGTPEANSATITYARSTGTIDAMSIDGVSTHGTKSVATITTTGATGSCPVISVKITMTKFVDPNRSEPKSDPLHNPTLASLFKSMPQLACHFTFVGDTAAKVQPDDLLFPVFSQSITETTLPSMATPIVGSLTVERGNVQTLSASDASLFEIPDGFTQSDT